MLNRTTVCVNFSDEPDRYPYVEDGASLPGRTVEELKSSLQQALSEDCRGDFQRRRQDFLHRHAGPTTEGAGASTLVEFFGRSCLNPS